MEEPLNLLAAVISRGAESSASIAAARRLLRHFGSVQGLACASKEEIRSAGKISEKQASALYLSLELGREACSAPLRAGERFSSSRELYHRYRARFFSARREYFFSLQLNSKNQLIREVLVSVGSLNVSVVHPREVFSFAVRDGTSAIILLHNHPSGDPAPSREDRECTKRLVNAGKILGIRVLDHIVIGHDYYYSFADASRLDDL
ncbi:MAG: DNA repair protein RadC [Acidobacteriota bacterium]|jgi:DNA repair protein RadC|nr:DNA repair protein RadC [Acidobacteriota bacterium]